jgi:hypothetical protein
MHHNHLYENQAIPGEYRQKAEAMFPEGWFAGQWPDLAALSGFAEALGVSAEYQRLLQVDKSTGEMRKFLSHFQNNLDLLIQKTWVEKTDESRKVKLLDEVPPLMDLILQERYVQALKQFGSIADELAYLFFGAQSTKDDFTEYTFRIDPQIGLFWWYGSQLGSLKKTDQNNITHDTSLWAVLLIGICYLTNF